MSLNFEGFIKDVKYRAFLTKVLKKYPIADFNINSSASCGLIETKVGEIGYSRWVSPKRTRTYPFERLYNTMNCPFRITIIPVIKDEGLDGDFDKIQYSTVSWMNLLNIYIILAYYDKAEKNVSKEQITRQKLTKQKLNQGIVIEQLKDLMNYKQSALHWNRSLMESKFASIYKTALDGYEKISQNTGVKVHPREGKDIYICEVMRDYEHFVNTSLSGSNSASGRELKTIHRLEYLTDKSKAAFTIKNYLGGQYFLTADEAEYKDGSYIIRRPLKKGDS
jgi:hypothetical protein